MSKTQNTPTLRQFDSQAERREYFRNHRDELEELANSDRPSAFVYQALLDLLDEEGSS